MLLRLFASTITLTLAVTFTALAAICELGCSRSSGTAETPQSNAIYGGTSFVEADAVSKAMLHFADCSGVLIGPRTALTASHCALRFKNAQVRFPARANEQCSETTVVEIKYAANRSQLIDGLYYLPDIAVLTLQSELCGAEPMALADETLSGPQLLRSKIFSAGYGFGTESVDYGDRVEMTVIATDQPSLQSYMASIKANSEFTRNLGKIIEQSGSTAPLFAITGDRSKSFCYGDSGGPVFVEKDGKPTLVGINSMFQVSNSRGNPQCAGAFIHVIAPIHSVRELIDPALMH